MPTTEILNQYQPLVLRRHGSAPGQSGTYVRHDGERVQVLVQQSFNVYWVYVVTSTGSEIAGRVTKQAIGVWSVGSRDVGQEAKAIRTGWTYRGKLTEAVERTVNEYLNHVADAFHAAERERRFDTYRIDTRIVRERLEAAGYRVTRTADSESDDIQVYLNGNSNALIVTTDGDATYVGWDATGGVVVEVQVIQADATTTLAQVVEESVLFLKRHELEGRVASLLEYLDTEVPDSVAHYAIEAARKALRVLQRQAFTVDLLHGKEV